MLKNTILLPGQIFGYKGDGLQAVLKFNYTILDYDRDPDQGKHGVGLK